MGCNDGIPDGKSDLLFENTKYFVLRLSQEPSLFQGFLSVSFHTLIVCFQKR